MHTSPILVTGASGGVQGATGNLIVKLLLGRGFAVRAFVHRIASSVPKTFETFVREQASAFANAAA